MMKHLQENVVPKMAGPVKEGVKNHLWAATAEVESGEFYEPVGVKESVDVDDGMAEKLWEWTEEQLKDQSL